MKIGDLSEKDLQAVFEALKQVLGEMTAQGGRDTEETSYRPGGYKTILSKNTVGRPCPACATLIRKEAYMGGRILCAAELPAPF